MEDDTGGIDAIEVTGDKTDNAAADDKGVDADLTNCVANDLADGTDIDDLAEGIAAGDLPECATGGIAEDAANDKADALTAADSPVKLLLSISLSRSGSISSSEVPSVSILITKNVLCVLNIQR